MKTSIKSCREIFRLKIYKNRATILIRNLIWIFMTRLTMSKKTDLTDQKLKAI